MSVSALILSKEYAHAIDARQGNVRALPACGARRAAGWHQNFMAL
jgi:Mlc titration factor MtfA (ptsG expression regulator)